MSKKILKIIKEYSPMITAILLFIGLIVLFMPSIRNKEISLSGRSGGTGETTGSLIEFITDNYDALVLHSGPVYLERVVIGNYLAGGGILIDNATNSTDAIRITELYGATVGSYEIGTYLETGLMITTSPAINASFIFTPF